MSWAVSQAVWPEGRGGDSLPQHTCETSPGALCAVLGSPASEACENVGVSSEESMEMIRGLENLSCKDRLERTGLV